jgi:hypothetical protein
MGCLIHLASKSFHRNRYKEDEYGSSLCVRLYLSVAD